MNDKLTPQAELWLALDAALVELEAFYGSDADDSAFVLYVRDVLSRTKVT